MSRTFMQGARPRVVIVGTGMIGAVHLRAARDAGGDVIGVLGSSADRSAEVAKAWGLARGYASYDEVLADEPDVVQICTPNNSHFDYALQALQAHINVVCEKPLAMTVEEATILADTARKSALVATVPFVYRYHPIVQELRARRIAGEFGSVNVVHGSYLQDWLLDPQSSSWRVDAAQGGRSRAFADIGSHWCDLAEFMSGERFAAVNAVTSIAYPTRPIPTGQTFGGSDANPMQQHLPVTTEDIALAAFTTDSRAVANVVISQVAAGRKNRLWVEVDGSSGSAVFDQENPESIWLGTSDGSRTIQRAAGSPSELQNRFNRVPAGHPQGYPDAFSAFLSDTYQAVAGGERSEGLPTFDDGLRSARIIDAVLKSAQTSTWTAIEA